MTQVIVYEIDGNQVVMTPVLDGTLTIEQIGDKDVPKGVIWSVVEASSLPIVERKNIYEISKVEIIRRMTTAEATSAELLIASADAKFRLMWSSANIIRSDDEWFPILQAALAGAFGEERAAQLLAPVA